MRPRPRRLPARARLRRDRAAGRRDALQRAGDARRAARSRCPRTSTACRRSSRAGSRARASTAADRATPRASSRRRSRRWSSCAPAASATSACCSSSARSAAATGPKSPTPRRRETSRFLINGEPTDNRLGIATRGVYRVRLHAHGRAAHSSYPELGESATEKLIDALVRLRTLPWPTDPDMGTTHYNIGLLSGGVAPNVTPPHAVAEVLFRTVAATPGRARGAVGAGAGGRRSRKCSRASRSGCTRCRASTPPRSPT